MVDRRTDRICTIELQLFKTAKRTMPDIPNNLNRDQLSRNPDFSCRGYRWPWNRVPLR